MSVTAVQLHSPPKVHQCRDTSAHEEKIFIQGHHSSLQSYVLSELQLEAENHSHRQAAVHL